MYQTSWTYSIWSNQNWGNQLNLIKIKIKSFYCDFLGKPYLNNLDLSKQFVADSLMKIKSKNVFFFGTDPAWSDILREKNLDPDPYILLRFRTGSAPHPLYIQYIQGEWSVWRVHGPGSAVPVPARRVGTVHFYLSILISPDNMLSIFLKRLLSILCYYAYLASLAWQVHLHSL